MQASSHTAKVTDEQADHALQQPVVQRILCHLELFNNKCPGCRKPLAKRNAMIKDHLGTWSGRSKPNLYGNHTCCHDYLQVRKHGLHNVRYSRSSWCL